MTALGRRTWSLASAFSAGLLLSSVPSSAATFAELSGGPAVNGSTSSSPYGVPGPYAPTPYAACPPNCSPSMPARPSGAEGVYPGSFDAQFYVPAYEVQPRAYLPIGPYGDLPANPLQLWTFGQINSTTDPFNVWGLSTPYMFVPWSTPLSAWTNSQTWNWWRERSGALPRNW